MMPIADHTVQQYDRLKIVEIGIKHVVACKCMLVLLRLVLAVTPRGIMFRYVRHAIRA